MADIATVSFNQSKVYELKHLSPEESWSLFCKKSFCGNPYPPHLEHLSGQFLKKCEGLPLAIMIYRSLTAELESNDRMQNFRKILNLSYNDLCYNLKSYFLYLVVFLEDHVIECMRLIHPWIAEGFVEKREGMTREDVGKRYLKELINISFVQIAQATIDGRLKSCRVHNLMRECILSKSRDEFLDEQFVTSGYRLLRVLDLGDSPLHEFPRQILFMFHLKHLSLRRTKVRIIPRSIGKLQNLETLDLKHTLVSKLPMVITKLIKLQHMLVYSIRALASLQKLSCVKAWRVTDLKTDNTKELGRSIEKMTDLQSLHVTVETEFEFIDLDFLSSPPPLLQGLYVKGCLKKLLHLKYSRLKLSPVFALQNLPNLMELDLVNAFDGEKLDFGDRAFLKLKKLDLAEMKSLIFVSINGQAMPCLQSFIIYKCRHLDWQSQWLLDYRNKLSPVLELQ
ncbi:hypothetical protein EUGRSUZ_H04244 [Eucalyptus grandis]|uniref:Uncharacterized protein n=2 Tax=Eucalyptus grandis TaxID=71139 RepID=A0A059B677_EUCGR|nr:hypothetical protein EUGRSUZ_H04244 [Eucalyptus grandis]